MKTACPLPFVTALGGVTAGAPLLLPAALRTIGSPAIAWLPASSAVTVTCEDDTPSAMTLAAGDATTVKVLGWLMKSTVVATVAVQVVPLSEPKAREPRRGRVEGVGGGEGHRPGVCVAHHELGGAGCIGGGAGS